MLIYSGAMKILFRLSGSCTICGFCPVFKDYVLIVIYIGLYACLCYSFVYGFDLFLYPPAKWVVFKDYCLGLVLLVLYYLYEPVFIIIGVSPSLYLCIKVVVFIGLYC